MERPGFDNSDEMTRLFWEVAQTMGSHGPDNHAGTVMPEQRTGVLPIEDQVELALDEEYYERRITNVQRRRDGSIVITVAGPQDDNEMPPFRYQHESLDNDPPALDETVRFYGLPYDDERGVVIGDRLYFYEPRVTIEGGEGSGLLERGDHSIDDAQLECGLRADSLPWPLKKAVIQASQKEPGGNINPIALGHVENAARIVNYFGGDADAIKAFMAASPEEREAKQAEIGIVGDPESLGGLVGECRVALWCIKQVGWDLETE
jgi:hypothetical protein